MVRPPSQTSAASNVASSSEMLTNPPNSQNDTQTIQVSGTGAVITPARSTNYAYVSSPSHTATSTAAPVSQAIPTIGNGSTQGFWNPGTISPRSMPYGMLSSLMQGLHTNPSTFSESLNVPLPQMYNPGVSVPVRTPQ